MNTGRALQTLNHAQLNTKSAHPNAAGMLKTPVKTGAVSKPDNKHKKKKEKLSALCKTPPSIVKTRSGRGYRRGSFLGEGGFARCFQMKDESGKVFAAKTVAKASIKNEKTKTKLLSEIKIHKSMSHPNIVQFVDCFEDEVNVYILLEICPNQSLMELLKNRKLLSEPEVRFFMVQIIGAIKYLHRRRVVHRDLKLGNIFFDPEMNLKIGDFGLATIISSADKKRYTICGTPNYIAPEVLGGKTVGHSFEVDLWAIGIMMYALLFGKPPFQAKDVQVIYDRIKHNEYQFPSDSKVSEEARILIRDILTTDPSQRPSLDEILEYEWFSSGPFPRSISVDSLTEKPRHFTYITKEESNINFNLCKQQVGINEAPKNPVEILKTDLESEKPKALLPNSLSPNNTKSKYREINATKYKTKIGNKLATAHQENRMIAILDDALSTTLENIKQVESGDSTKINDAIEKPILISKWVDYSNKHGFSYQLSTGCTGFLFNNGQSLLKVQDVKEFCHILADTQNGWSAGQFSGYNASLSKEIDIVEFFEKYMSKHLSDVSSANKKSSKDREVFLRRYTREDNYLMFELSNGSYQFNFKDHHKIVLSQYGQFITHITPNKDIEILPLSYVLENGNFYEYPDEFFEVKYDFMKHALRQKLTV